MQSMCCSTQLFIIDNDNDVGCDRGVNGSHPFQKENVLHLHRNAAESCILRLENWVEVLRNNAELRMKREGRGGAGRGGAEQSDDDGSDDDRCDESEGDATVLRENRQFPTPPSLYASPTSPCQLTQTRAVTDRRIHARDVRVRSQSFNRGVGVCPGLNSP